MATKKDLIIAVLVTFCLTVTIFMIMPIKSANNSYDPMLDANHDGKINILDIGAMAKAYGSSGDPTIPVTLNDNWTEGSFSFSLPANNVTQDFIVTTAGFKTITLSLNASGGGSFLEIFIGYLSGNNIVGWTTATAFAPGMHLMVYLYPWYNNLYEPIFTQSYQVTSPQMMFCIWNNSTTTGVAGSLYYYLST